jgi:hypothetical protein
MGLIFICLQFPGSQAAANSSDTNSSAVDAETFRIRVNNSLYGPVEVSADDGITWRLIARVIRPAEKNKAGADQDQPIVERVSRWGIAFGVGDGRMLRILPDGKKARQDRAAILINVKAGSSLFGSLLPQEGSHVMLQANRDVTPIPAGYAPEDEDQFVIIDKGAIPGDKTLLDVVRQEEEAYSQLALQRLEDRGGKTISGILTVKARLSPGDHPASVTFTLDSDKSLVCLSPPYEIKWNTLKWSDGEHLIEITAKNISGRVLSRLRYLVYFENTPSHRK